MKKFIFTCAALFSLVGSYAQSDANNGQSDQGRIIIAAYVPDQTENLPEGAKNLLVNKLSQIATEGGMSGSALNERFVIAPNIVVMNKEITPTAPAMVVLSLDVNLYIGDGIDGTKFSSTSLSVKGVGSNETKAYISALKNISVTNPALQAFLEKGKAKIVQFYKTRCDFIMKEAQAQANMQNFDQALVILTGVPQVCKECYIRAVDAIRPIYKKAADKDCQVRLAQARATWSANQSIDGANAAADILSGIDPSAACFNEAKTFVSQMAKGVKDINNMEWKYIFKEQQNRNDVIKAARDVAIAYYTHQPQSVIYNLHGWW